MMEKNIKIIYMCIYMYNWITLLYTWKFLINYNTIKIKLKKLSYDSTKLGSWYETYFGIYKPILSQ